MNSSSFDMRFKNSDKIRLGVIRDSLAAAGNDLTLPQLISLLTIAIEPGLSVNDLAERTGAPQQSASRFVAVLLGRYPSLLGVGPKEPLIMQQINADDPRKRALFLTTRGRELVASMISPNSPMGA